MGATWILILVHPAKHGMFSGHSLPVVGHDANEIGSGERSLQGGWERRRPEENPRDETRMEKKGIAILAPMAVNKRDEKDFENEPRVITLFKVVYVFDVSQTEGDPLPDLIHATGDVSALYPALMQAVQKEGITLEVQDDVPGLFGALGASYGGRIVLRADLAPADAFRTLVHEYAHELLHWRAAKEDRTIRETEADATAFIVCRRFNVECDTADYLLLHDSTTQVLLERLETVRRTAARIIEGLEREENAEGGQVDDTPAAA